MIARPVSVQIQSCAATGQHRSLPHIPRQDRVRYWKRVCANHVREGPGANL